MQSCKAVTAQEADTFDYIIAGGGLAGLSLAFYLNESERLRANKVLILDRQPKTANDHTWCFWEKEAGAFEEIVFRRWQSVRFHGAGSFSSLLDLGGYEYKMIRAADFYRFVFSKIDSNPNFTFLQTEIRELENARVSATAGDFRANEFVFDSFTRKTYDNPQFQNLWQHFKGWTIETEVAAFNPDEATLFDFRVEQKGECHFAYVLPFSPNQALIEFTVFSDNLLPDREYDSHLKKYIREVLRITEFKILETERGVIPMSDEPHEPHHAAPSVLRIGTAGGYVKPSTGYSFSRTQRRLREIAAQLEAGEIPHPKSRIRKWKSYLDSVLLNVLRTKKHPADEVFTALFARNETAQILKFLDEDTSPAEDFAIMKTVPLAPFLRAAVETAVKKAK